VKVLLIVMFVGSFVSVQICLSLIISYLRRHGIECKVTGVHIIENIFEFIDLKTRNGESYGHILSILIASVVAFFLSVLIPVIYLKFID